MRQAQGSCEAPLPAAAVAAVMPCQATIMFFSRLLCWVSLCLCCPPRRSAWQTTTCTCSARASPPSMPTWESAGEGAEHDVSGRAGGLHYKSSLAVAAACASSAVAPEVPNKAEPPPTHPHPHPFPPCPMQVGGGGQHAHGVDHAGQDAVAGGAEGSGAVHPCLHPLRPRRHPHPHHLPSPRLCGERRSCNCGSGVGQPAAAPLVGAAKHGRAAELMRAAYW